MKGFRVGGDSNIKKETAKEISYSVKDRTILVASDYQTKPTVWLKNN